MDELVRAGHEQRGQPAGPESPQRLLELVGTQRLAARVYELEAEGYRITRTLITTPRGTAIRERQDIVYREMSTVQPATSAKAPPPPPVPAANGS